MPPIRWATTLSPAALRPALCAVALGLLLSGCHLMGGQPKMQPPQITPSELNPGDSATITVKVNDPEDIVERVEGVLIDNEDIEFALRDDGEGGDATAEDDVWTIQVEVPVLAPPGGFLMRFTAYRSDGTPVPVRGEDGPQPLSAELPVTITFAEPDAG